MEIDDAIRATTRIYQRRRLIEGALILFCATEQVRSDKGVGLWSTRKSSHALDTPLLNFRPETNTDRGTWYNLLEQ